MGRWFVLRKRTFFLSALFAYLYLVLLYIYKTNDTLPTKKNNVDFMRLDK